ncbi:MAG TPA: thioredoxin domain-containing protein [Deltaproteobacteria bacterium]|nr:thioredoxin domain-containing protein [Deltaproteobacteria bacterium]
MEANEKNRLNHLADEKSPYLLQHVHNPVDWHPWNEKAFKKAAEEDKPVFLSIGYATCHWCHVMAHESFEDEEVADILNRDYVSIKVDREERPDVDKIYMSVCQALTGRGGWPLTIIITPDGKPFFAATYLPKTGRMGMSGLVDVLAQLAALWKNDRARILKAGDSITNAIEAKNENAPTAGKISMQTLKIGYEQCAKSYDTRWGGFGNAPKFPTPHNKTFLLRWHRRNIDSRGSVMVENTLDHMRRGGIFDQIGFGFHRYSVDREWLVPHFEKMLYDQALLAMAYMDAFQVIRDKKFENVAREIFTYVLRDMTDPDGGFYSAEDADSQGEEGLFYVWKPEEVKKHLGDEAGTLFCRFYDITEQGNFEEGQSIPHIPVPLEIFALEENIEPEALAGRLEGARETLFQNRGNALHAKAHMCGNLNSK